MSSDGFLRQVFLSRAISFAEIINPDAFVNEVIKFERRVRKEVLDEVIARIDKQLELIRGFVVPDSEKDWQVKSLKGYKKMLEEMKKG